MSWHKPRQLGITGIQLFHFIHCFTDTYMYNIRLIEFYIFAEALHDEASKFKQQAGKMSAKYCFQNFKVRSRENDLLIYAGNVNIFSYLLWTTYDISIKGI